MKSAVVPIHDSEMNTARANGTTGFRRAGCARSVVAILKAFLPAFLVLCVASAWGQSKPGEREPHIGYVYPAGGKQGTVVRITVGGQFLNGVTDAYVSGEGVHASVIKFYRPIRNIQKEQREELIGRLKAAWQKLEPESAREELSDSAKHTEKKSAVEGRRSVRDEARNPQQRKAREAKKATAAATDNTKTAKPTGKKDGAKKGRIYKPVEHPLLENLDKQSLGELANAASMIFFPRQKKEINSQIGEMVLIEVTIDADASPGDREIRLLTPLGLTNPMIFQVGTLPEVNELEPNDPKGDNPLPFARLLGFRPLPPPPVLQLPVELNGQIMPGDVDRFHFHARKGQHIVAAAQARHLIPYLADTVPGWFQATLALYDPNGKEVAFDDDYRFDPDPVLFYTIPEDGDYQIEIRDALYRGREDFVYRVALGELPFITRMFPLGGKSGKKVEAQIDGWNLPKKRVQLDTSPGTDLIRQATVREGRWISNPVSYFVDTLPESNESEPNDSIKKAQAITLPRMINGIIAHPGDKDVYRFDGDAGETVVAEVYARRLNSPLDSLLRLIDGSGRVVAWNDDHEDKGAGLVTHQADSYLSARLPAGGVYYVQVSDVEHHGGEAFAYRLRISRPEPDFELRLTPPSLTFSPGRWVPVTVHAIRKDGFDGAINLSLKDAPTGFALSGARIPAGRDSVRFTVRAPWRVLDQPVALHLEGRAHVADHTITRPVVPAEDRMQAFIYRHLAPTQELLVAGTRRRGVLPAELADSEPVKIPAGGTARVELKIPPRFRAGEIHLQLDNPPKGVTLHDVVARRGALTFRVAAAANGPKPGFADNLIVDVILETPGRRPAAKGADRAKRRGIQNTANPNSKETTNKANKKPPRTRRIPLGVLPAIPFEIVQP